MRRLKDVSTALRAALFASAVFLASPPAHAGPSSEAAAAPLLRYVDDIRQLSPTEAAQGRPVRIQATVTYYHHEWDMLFVQDDTGGVFVYVDHRKPAAPIRKGDLVEIQGVTVPGDFIPSIAHPRFRNLGHVGLPSPQPVTLKDMARPENDARWLEVSGIITQAAVVDDLVNLTLLVDGAKLKVYVKDFEEETDLAALVDSQVRLHGVCATLVNDRRQFVRRELWSPDLRQHVVIEGPAPADPFALPRHSIESLRRLGFGGGYERRLKVAGTVTLQQPGHGVFIQDETDGVFIQSPRGLPLSPGDRIEAVGFLKLDEADLSLENGVLRRIESGDPPAPAAMTAEEAVGGQLRARMVKVQGRLVGTLFNSGEQALVLQDREVVFNARLATGALPEALTSLKAGSLLELTGVASTQAHGAGAPSLQVLLRSPADVAVLDRPSWWTSGRVRGLLGLVMGVFVAAGAWASVLRRRVRLETEAIRQRLERETALAERLTLAVRGTNDGIWDWDLSSDRIYLSPRWKSMLGYAEEEVGDTPADWLRLVHPDELERLQEKLAAHREGETPHFEDEHRMRHKDGTYHWMLSRGSALRDERGRATRMAGAQTDVTDRRSNDPLMAGPGPGRKVLPGDVDRAAAVLDQRGSLSDEKAPPGGWVRAMPVKRQGRPLLIP